FLCSSCWCASCSRIVPSRPKRTMSRSIPAPGAKERNMHKQALTFTLAATISLVLTGCTLAPRYERPTAPVADTWPTGAAYDAAQSDEQADEKADAKTAANVPWREFIKDRKLQEVIDLALATTRDLRGYLANIQAARAQYRIQRADLFPR